MATFQINEDQEKENPHKNPAIAAVFTNKEARPTNQSYRVDAAGVGLKQTMQLNNKTKAFREVGNVNTQSDKALAASGAIKKANVLPLEQFKPFSIYEDGPEDIPKKIVATMPPFVDKENNNDAWNEESIESELFSKQTTESMGFSFNSTPMSVSASIGLSPMSVDTSLVTDASAVKAEKHKCSSKSVPLNDRQRFYEVVDYQRDILDYFRESEVNLRPKANYMRRQTDISNSMRTILIDWLVEVAEEYNLDTETLYLAVAYIDRFLSQMSVVRSKLQLVGTAAMYIASKYEEIYPPDVGEYVFITDDTYTKAQVLRMEQIILKILSFDLCTPTAYAFINTYSVLCDMTDEVKHLTMFISELTLLHSDPFLNFLPSLISAGALAVARLILRLPIWSPELEEITCYRLEDLKVVCLALCEAHANAPNLNQQALVEKYKSEKYSQVANISANPMDSNIFDQLIENYNASPEGKSNIIGETSQQKSSENVRRMISAMFN